MTDYLVEEIVRVTPYPSDQNALDYCLLRVRATVAWIFGYERAMSEPVTTGFFVSGGMKFARAFCDLDREEVAASRATIK